MTEDIFHLGIKGLIRNEAGEVLLLRVNPAELNGDRKDYWDLPGGRVQKGADVLTTLKREIEEETGIILTRSPKPIGMVLANIRIPLGDDLSAGLILSVYACSVPASAQVTLSDEHIAYEWVALAEAADRLRIKYPADFCKMLAALPNRA